MTTLFLYIIFIIAKSRFFFTKLNYSFISLSLEVNKLEWFMTRSLTRTLEIHYEICHEPFAYNPYFVIFISVLQTPAMWETISLVFVSHINTQNICEYNKIKKIYICFWFRWYFWIFRLYMNHFRMSWINKRLTRI